MSHMVFSSLSQAFDSKFLSVLQTWPINFKNNFIYVNCDYSLRMWSPGGMCIGMKAYAFLFPITDLKKKSYIPSGVFM